MTIDACRVCLRGITVNGVCSSCGKKPPEPTIEAILGAAWIKGMVKYPERCE